MTTPTVPPDREPPAVPTGPITIPDVGGGDGDGDPVLNLEACPSGIVGAGGIDEVPDSSVHRRAIDCLSWWGIAIDDAPEGYEPSDPVTRGQLATFLTRVAAALGIELPTGVDTFSDDDGSEYEADLDALADLGVFRGDGKGGVDPERPVTRGQLASLLVRLWAAMTGASLTTDGDAFGDDDGSVHEAAIDALAAAGVTTGTGDGFDPDAPVRRDQLASFLARLLGLLVPDPDDDADR